MTQRQGMTVGDLINDYLPISEDTVYRLCREGKIPHQKIGRRIIFYRRTIEAWLEKGEAGS